MVRVVGSFGHHHQRKGSSMSVATLEMLADQVRRLPALRQQVLQGEIEQAANMEDETAATKNMPGQLDLFGFKELMQLDDDLRVVTLDTIAETYDIGLRSLLRYIADGELRATRFGRRYVVTVNELRRFMTTSRVMPPRGPGKQASKSTSKKGGTDAHETNN